MLQPHRTTTGKPKPVVKISRSWFLPYAGLKKHSNIPYCSICHEIFKSTLSISEGPSLIYVGVSVTIDVVALVSLLDIRKVTETGRSPQITCSEQFFSPLGFWPILSFQFSYINLKCKLNW